ncbi:MAG: hypothetical protein QOJ89_3750 [bacterium]|jgi:acetyl esterase/lipase
MPRALRHTRLALAALASVFLSLALGASPSEAALWFSKPKAPPPAPVIAPVADPISADPASVPVRGTMIMVHGGGWAGHDAHAQEILMQTPGALLLARGWRIVSIDYDEGTAGLADVLDAAGAELQRRSGDGPLCIYGESSGAHLALVAASKLRAIDCVIGLGVPTDIARYETDAAASDDNRLRAVAMQMTKFFGTTPEQAAPWDLLALAPEIAADVLLLHEGDDSVVPVAHQAAFQAIRPSTQTVELEAGDPADESTHFVHGTISALGRTQYDAAIGAIADRAVAARDAERAATRSGCAQVSRSFAEVGPAALQSALRCLARADDEAVPVDRGTWQRTAMNVRGEINAARLWSELRTTQSGRRALAATGARRVRLAVRAGDPSRVVLRATRPAPR